MSTERDGIIGEVCLFLSERGWLARDAAAYRLPESFPFLVMVHLLYTYWYKSAKIDKYGVLSVSYKDFGNEFGKPADWTSKQIGLLVDLGLFTEQHRYIEGYVFVRPIIEAIGDIEPEVQICHER